MTTQPEQVLEDNLVAQLVGMAYEKVAVHDEKSLLANLKAQLEAHNGVALSDNAFRQVITKLSKGSIFEKAKTLRDRVTYLDENGDTKTLELLDMVDWCKNRFQVTQQITVEGKYRNRYDVTILINGLPLVQIELKRRGLELKEAFNQTNRYERHSYGAGDGLFQYIQLFVISNGVNTKYYANNRVSQRSFKQTFFWTDPHNKRITQLAPFTDQFLEPCHLAKMVTRYTVLNESRKMLMVLRPYQVYATEAIVERVQHGRGFGYVWHTTGSGKTLTSFKTSQILTGYPKVDKILFVVDRRDLDYQTTKEFNSFRKGSIDATGNTKALVEQLGDPNTKLIVTTIQKLNNAVKKAHYGKVMEPLRDKRVIFIFDECHRSQFGETHQAIKGYFSRCQMFGFTGTPIFADNAMSTDKGKTTTKQLFGDCLHSYVITDAIRDENVLKFSVEYMKTFKQKDGQIADMDVEGIDEAEVLDSPDRHEAVARYILQHHARKTHNHAYNAIFCVSGIPSVISYYKQLRALHEAGEHDLKVATIFSYQANEEDQDAAFPERDDMVDLSVMEPINSGPDAYQTKHSRDYLEDFIGEYNVAFGTNFTTRDSDSFYRYYEDIAKRMKTGQIDILLVANMFLTGFDCPGLNTLYVDKRLRHHGLIQAYSRTNRLHGELKSQGNIVCFQNLKKATDEAIALFANKNPVEEILLNPYEDYIEEFNAAFVEMIRIAPSVNSVTKLADEEQELAFIKVFRAMIRLLNVLQSFSEFSFDDLSLSEQQFADYKSKYLDLHDKVQSNRTLEKVSILEDIDFELELIHRDEINVAYILKLLAELKEAPLSEQPGRMKSILDLLGTETELRSKRELIEAFIEKNLPRIDDPADIPEAFEAFWAEAQQAAFDAFATEEGMDPDQLQHLVSDYLYTSKLPLTNQVVEALNTRPPLKERAPTADRIIHRIQSFIDTFINGK